MNVTTKFMDSYNHCVSSAMKAEEARASGISSY
jgi:hypothetical protein